MEETVTEEYRSGEMVKETHKTITMKTVEQSILSFNSAVQGPTLDDGIGFTIYNDEDENMQILNEEDDTSIRSVDVENDKENQDPAKMDSMDLEDSPTSHISTKRKHVSGE